LFDGADIVMTPTIADGDIQISLDGGAFNPPATLPSATPAASGQVQIPLAQAETNAVHIGIRGIDQVGAQWDDFYYSIFTDTGTIGELGTILSGITSLADWLGALAGKTTDAITLAEIQATTAGVNYDNTTDGLEALADTKAAPGDAMDLVAGAVDATAVAVSGATEIADEVLKRGVSNVEDTADTASLAAIILSILESSITGTTWTIRKTDGTAFTTKTVTLDASADPITGVT
jgi:hypothetical protein